jgi:hypothetical protein
MDSTVSLLISPYVEDVQSGSLRSIVSSVMLTNDAGRSATADKTKALKDGGVRLEDSMRRLSIISDTSSFSIISRADSFDSVRSFDSHEPFEEQSAAGDVSHVDLDSVSGPESKEHKETIEKFGELSLNSSNSKADINPAWAQFTDFVHSPTAHFKSEFARLAHMKGWNKKMKKQQFVALLSSEVAFYWGADEDKLEQCQEMCRHLGLTLIPGTVTQCKKVRF